MSLRDRLTFSLALAVLALTIATVVTVGELL